MWRPWLIGLGCLVAVALLLVSVLYAFQRRIIYLPATDPVPAAASFLPGARDVTFDTADGIRLGGWFVPARGTDTGFTVLVAAGNAGDRSMRAPLAHALSGRGLSVLLFDYRGFGGNPGSPSEEGLTQDIRAAHRFLTAELGVPQDRLRYYGESLGCSLVTKLATERPPAALVLRSPFTDLPSVGQLQYPFLPVRSLLWDRFPVAEDVRRVTAPITVVYGDADSIVPPEQSVEVAAAGRARAVPVHGADHNDRSLLDGDQLVDAVVNP
ncbi:alpha/beta hydrolase [Amycolatopsis magusensis]|uniref:alpha/beta hydrolase n=1 Tax=Amycolatopsis magusensis TaxID=882444 RepID=UPI003C306D44